MDDLISRWEAIDALTDTNLKRNVDSVCDGDMNRTRRAAQRVIAQLPAVDAAPVVRCKYCKHRPTDNSDEKSCGGFDIEFPDAVCPCQCDDGYYSFYPDDDWFCANGEHRDGDA